MSAEGADKIKLQDSLGETTPETEIMMGKARSIHAALSNSDSLRIFNLTSKGIDASTSVLRKYQFTKKRYYGRLKELVDLGLVYKQNGEYTHTPLGHAVFESQVSSLEKILVNKGNTTEADIHALIPQANPLNITGTSASQPVRFFGSWIELSSQVSLRIESMKSEVYVATRYADFRTADTALRAASRGCRVNILRSDRNGLSAKLQVVGNLMSHPKAAGVYKELVENKNIRIAEASLPYSFIVVDGVDIGIEVVSPEDPYSFFFGLEFENKDFAGKLISQFEKLSEHATRDSIGEVVQNEKAAPWSDRFVTS